MRSTTKLVLTAALMTAIACNNGEKTKESNTDSVAAIPADTAQVAAAPTEKTFDINAIAISDKPLGTFPYFTLPEGYQNYEKNPVVDFDRLYFWVGDHFERPEGKIFWSRIKAKEGKTFSDLEVIKGMEETMAGLGGAKIYEGTVTQDSLKAIDETRRVKYNSGWGFIGFKPSAIYLVRHTDRNIWVQMTPGDDGVSYGWAILETKPVQPAASK